MRLKQLFGFIAGLAFAGAAGAQSPTVAQQVAPPPVSQENVWNLDLSNGGRVSIQLRPDIAPNHVERIKTLTRQGFYNGLVFHRVIDGFMAQGGDPKGDGTGSSELPDLTAEFNVLPHVRGTVSAARGQDENSANSQFFIMLAPRLSLDRKYSACGRVISGMSYVDAIEKGEPPVTPTRILRASLGSDNLPPPAPVAAPAMGPESPTAEPTPTSPQP